MLLRGTEMFAERAAMLLRGKEWSAASSCEVKAPLQ